MIQCCDKARFIYLGQHTIDAFVIKNVHCHSTDLVVFVPGLASLSRQLSFSFTPRSGARLSTSQLVIPVF
jgi:hypothetical protein